MTGVITWVVDRGDGWFIERGRPSTASELMATLSGLSSPFQPGSSSTRVNTAQLVNNYAGANVRVTSWLEQYLKQQQEEAAEKKAAEEAAAAEQADAEQAAFEAQKQAYKDDADVVFELESPGHVDLTEVQGVDSNDNMFVEIKGDLISTSLKTGGGDDVIYFGDNENYFTDDYINMWVDAWAGSGNDKIFGGDGTQVAHGGKGGDLIDLGDGYDVAHGDTGADEFVIDLQNSGFDLITDFINIGDKITIYNGGELAQADDWMLVSVGSEWTGLMPPGSLPGNPGANYANLYGDGNEFYEIQSADGKTAARFSAGMKASSAFINEWDITVQKGVAGLEVVESKASPLTGASVEFV